jgi:hypothetical protein
MIDMNTTLRLMVSGIAGPIAIGFGLCTNVLAADPGVVSQGAALSQSQAAGIAQAIQDYWTPARMAAAKPMPTPAVVIDPALLDAVVSEPALTPDAVPGYATGCSPANAATCESVAHELLPGDPRTAAAMAQPMHGTAPANPLAGPYGPFQRWAEHDPITVNPKSTIGKLFFTLNGSNFVCSASVIGRSTLATAGHCVSDGAGHFSTNTSFCPSYRDGASTTRGCWSVITRTTSSRWHTLADPDYDYACMVTATTGTVVANKIGNVTGWLGRAWNFSPAQAERTFGYPQAAPFTGLRLMTTASTDWYSFAFVAGLQTSKIIGSDLTGGSSGGPWILGWANLGNERADSDARSATDPGNNWINGVNSHKRCLVDCRTPPIATAGVFWQEMSSPPFMNTTATGESEDVFAICLAHANNLP